MKTQREDDHLWTGEQSFTRHRPDHTGTLPSDFQPSEQLEKFLLFISFLVYSILLQWPEWTKTVIVRVIIIVVFFFKVLVTQSCPTLCDPMDCSPPGSSVHGILQARILEWVAMSFSRGSSQPRDWTWVSCTAGRFFTIWATREDSGFYFCIYFFPFSNLFLIGV